MGPLLISIATILIAFLTVYSGKSAIQVLILLIYVTPSMHVTRPDPIDPLDLTPWVVCLMGDPYCFQNSKKIFTAICNAIG